MRAGRYAWAYFGLYKNRENSTSPGESGEPGDRERMDTSVRGGGWAPRGCDLGTPASRRRVTGAPVQAAESAAILAPQREPNSWRGRTADSAGGVPSGVPKPKNSVLEGKRMASGDTGNFPA